MVAERCLMCEWAGIDWYFVGCRIWPSKFIGGEIGREL